jgi:hypothetical protein
MMVFFLWCCVGDGGWPSVVALQGEITNYPKVRRLRAVRAERWGKGVSFERVRCDPMKANESEPQVTCRKALMASKPGDGALSRDESGGCLFIGQMVPGMYAARARVRLLHGTWEPVVSRNGRPVVHDLRLGVSGRVSSGRNRERRGPVVGHRGGPSGSSVKGPVMGLERSGRAIQARLTVNHDSGRSRGCDHWALS